MVVSNCETDASACGATSNKKRWCVLQRVYDSNFANLTSRELNILKDERLKRIEILYAICVVNIECYLGESTKLEIEFANK